MPAQTPDMPETSRNNHKKDYAGLDEKTMGFESPDHSFDSNYMSARGFNNVSTVQKD